MVCTGRAGMRVGGSTAGATAAKRSASAVGGTEGVGAGAAGAADAGATAASRAAFNASLGATGSAGLALRVIRRDQSDGEVSPPALTANENGVVPTMKNAASAASPTAPMTRVSTPV